MNTKKNMSLAMGLLICITCSMQVVAEQQERNILSIGCNKEDGICLVELNGDQVGPLDCAANQLQFNVLKDKNADANFSLLTAAFFANKKVRFSVADDCQNRGDVPTFSNFQVLN